MFTNLTLLAQSDGALWPILVVVAMFVGILFFGMILLVPYSNFILWLSAKYGINPMMQVALVNGGIDETTELLKQRQAQLKS